MGKERRRRSLRKRGVRFSSKLRGGGDVKRYGEFLFPKLRESLSVEIRLHHSRVKHANWVLV